MRQLNRDITRSILMLSALLQAGRPMRTADLAEVAKCAPNTALYQLRRLQRGAAVAALDGGWGPGRLAAARLASWGVRFD